MYVSILICTGSESHSSRNLKTGELGGLSLRLKYVRFVFGHSIATSPYRSMLSGSTGHTPTRRNRILNSHHKGITGSKIGAKNAKSSGSVVAIAPRLAKAFSAIHATEGFRDHVLMKVSRALKDSSNLSPSGTSVVMFRSTRTVAVSNCRNL
jgi:hypothetical protein